MTHETAALLEKAEQSIAAASLLLDDDYIDFAASRAYYAMFYAVEALLLSREMSFSKHSAVIAAFGKEFIKTGIIDARFHKMLLSAFDLRNAGDYGIMHTVSEQQAKQVILDSKEMLIVITAQLGVYS